EYPYSSKSQSLGAQDEFTFYRIIKERGDIIGNYKCNQEYQDIRHDLEKIIPEEVTRKHKASLKEEERDQNACLDHNIERDTEDHPFLLHPEIVCSTFKEAQYEVNQA